MARSYRGLLAWQKAKALAVDVFRATETFPRSQLYGLTSQLRRAAVSVASNIAEGQGRLTPGEFLHRRVMKAYLLKESLDRLWSYTYEGAMLRYLQSWIDQLRWQRLKPMVKLAHMLLDHLGGILNYCRIKVPHFGTALKDHQAATD